MHVVVVGNGVAGIEAAALVRAREPGWALTVVSEESDHFFSRTALMYVLAGQLAYRDTEPLERDAAERLRYTRVRKRAIGLDPASRTLRLANAEPLRYDRLLLACGSRPRRPAWSGLDLGGVGTFVTMQDLEWLEAEVHGGPGVDRPPNADAHEPFSTQDSPYRRRPARGGVRRPVVVGGGLIGIEVVESLLAAGLRPTFLLRDEAFWPVALDARESARVVAALEAHGVDVRRSTGVVALEGDASGRVARVVTSAGALDADLVVVAIGVSPNTDWLGGAVDRDEGGGVVVDRHLRTSAPDVWAAGDCASVPWADGRRAPEPLWYTARDQGRVAGRQLAGESDAAYLRGVWYNAAKLMDLEYTTVGLVNARVPGEASWFFEEPPPVSSTTRVVHVDGRVIGFNFLGRRWDTEVCARWIRERRGLGWVVAHLSEAAFDTEFVPPLVVPADRVPKEAP